MLPMKKIGRYKISKHTNTFSIYSMAPVWMAPDWSKQHSIPELLMHVHDAWILISKIQQNSDYVNAANALFFSKLSMCFYIGSPALISWPRRLSTQNEQLSNLCCCSSIKNWCFGISRFGTWSAWSMKMRQRTELLPEEKQVTFYPGRCV